MKFKKRGWVVFVADFGGSVLMIIPTEYLGYTSVEQIFRCHDFLNAISWHCHYGKGHHFEFRTEHDVKGSFFLKDSEPERFSSEIWINPTAGKTAWNNSYNREKFFKGFFDEFRILSEAQARGHFLLNNESFEEFL